MRSTDRGVPQVWYITESSQLICLTFWGLRLLSISGSDEMITRQAFGSYCFMTLGVCEIISKLAVLSYDRRNQVSSTANFFHLVKHFIQHINKKSIACLLCTTISTRLVKFYSSYDWVLQNLRNDTQVIHYILVTSAIFEMATLTQISSRKLNKQIFTHWKSI